MPTVCSCKGITIWVLYREHPPPHFHVTYAGRKAQVGINPLGVFHGDLPRRVERDVIERAERHQSDLARAWRQAEQRYDIDRIKP